MIDRSAALRSRLRIAQGCPWTPHTIERAYSRHSEQSGKALDSNRPSRYCLFKRAASSSLFAMRYPCSSMRLR